MVLTKDQVREFWEQLSDPGFDAKLQTFFDMYVMTHDWFTHSYSPVFPLLPVVKSSAFRYDFQKLLSLLMSELA